MNDIVYDVNDRAVFTMRPVQSLAAISDLYRDDFMASGELWVFFCCLLQT